MDKQYITSNNIFWAFYTIIIIIFSLGLLFPYPYNFIPILIPLIIVSFVLIIKHPFVGLLIYYIFILIRPQEFLSILSSIPLPYERIIALLLIVVLAFKLKRDKFRVFISNIDKSLLFFLIATFLSAILSVWIEQAFDTWYKLLGIVIASIIITHTVDTKKQLNYFIYFIIFSAFFHASASIINYYNGIYIYRMGIIRAVGVDSSYGNPNSLAATLAYTFPFIYYSFKKSIKIYTKILLICVFFILLWCIILTGSRTGMIGVIFISFYLILQNKNKLINLFLVLILLFFTWIVMPMQYKERFLSTTDIESDTGAASSAHGRIEGLIGGYLMLRDRPLLGYGIGCFAFTNGSIYGRGYYQSHSLPGQLMGELGLIGILAFIVWMFYIFKYLKILSYYQLQDFEITPLIIALRTELYSLFLFGFGGHNLYRYNWYIVSAIVVVLYKIKKKESQQQAPE